MNSKQKRQRKREIVRMWGDQAADAVALARLQGKDHVICKGRRISLNGPDPVAALIKELSTREHSHETWAWGQISGAGIDRAVIDEATAFKRIDDLLDAQRYAIGQAL